MSITRLDCQVSKIINSDMRPRPMAQAFDKLWGGGGGIYKVRPHQCASTTCAAHQLGTRRASTHLVPTMSGVHKACTRPAACGKFLANPVVSLAAFCFVYTRAQGVHTWCGRTVQPRAAAYDCGHTVARGTRRNAEDDARKLAGMRAREAVVGMTRRGKRGRGAKLAQKLNAWANLHLLGQAKTFLAKGLELRGVARAGPVEVQHHRRALPVHQVLLLSSSLLLSPPPPGCCSSSSVLLVCPSSHAPPRLPDADAPPPPSPQYVWTYRDHF
jgi:hypothetical protein